MLRFSSETSLSILLLLPCFFASATALAADARFANAKLISRAVGEVGDHVVTSREVLINQAVAQAMDAKSAPGEADATLDAILGADEKTLPGLVYRTLDTWSIYLEAKSLNEKDVGRLEQAETMKKVEARWSGKPAWQALEVSGEELREIVGRHLVAGEFERLKADPQLAPVNDEDALAYYRKNRSRFGNLPFSDVKDNIKAFLVKNQSEHRLNEWHEILRRKYRVRNFIAG